MMKITWIVDGSYLFNSIRLKFDYLKLKTELESINGTSFFESYYLNSTQNAPSDAQDGFHTWLKLAPPTGPKMRVKLYSLKSISFDLPDGSKPHRINMIGSFCPLAMAILRTPSVM